MNSLLRKINFFNTLNFYIMITTRQEAANAIRNYLIANNAEAEIFNALNLLEDTGSTYGGTGENDPDEHAAGCKCNLCLNP